MKIEQPLKITTVTGKTFSITVLPEDVACSYEPFARYTYGSMLLAKWNDYGTNGRAIGMVKRFAKQPHGWPVDVEWFIYEGTLYYKK